MIGPQRAEIGLRAGDLEWHGKEEVRIAQNRRFDALLEVAREAHHHAPPEDDRDVGGETVDELAHVFDWPEWMRAQTLEDLLILGPPWGTVGDDGSLTAEVSAPDWPPAGKFPVERWSWRDLLQFLGQCLDELNAVRQRRHDQENGLMDQANWQRVTAGQDEVESTAHFDAEAAQAQAKRDWVAVLTYVSAHWMAGAELTRHELGEQPNAWLDPLSGPSGYPRW